MGKPGTAGTPAAVSRSRLAVRTPRILVLTLAIAVVPLDVLSRQGSPAEPLGAAASFTAVGLVVRVGVRATRWAGSWPSSAS